MTPRVERHSDAALINRVANDPAVFPWVHGYSDGPLDLTEIVADPANVLLMGEHGGLLFVQLQPGLYDVHTSVLPEGRGKWALDVARLALHWMFCRTDAMEILTRCPRGNIAATALARRVGMRPSFMNPKGWVRDGELIPAEIYSLTVQDWIRTAPAIEDRGAWFRARLAAEFRRHGRGGERSEDDTGDRHIGAAFDMLSGGQLGKAVALFNRYAALADRAPIAVTLDEPLTVNLGGEVLIVVRQDDFWVASFLTTGLSRAA